MSNIRSRISKLERGGEPDNDGSFLGSRRFWQWFASEPGTFALTPAEEAELTAAVQNGPPPDALDRELERLIAECHPQCGFKELPNPSPN